MSLVLLSCHWPLDPGSWPPWPFPSWAWNDHEFLFYIPQIHFLFTSLFSHWPSSPAWTTEDGVLFYLWSPFLAKCQKLPSWGVQEAQPTEQALQPPCKVKVVSVFLTLCRAESQVSAPALSRNPRHKLRRLAHYRFQVPDGEIETWWNWVMHPRSQASRVWSWKANPGSWPKSELFTIGLCWLCFSKLYLSFEGHHPRRQSQLMTASSQAGTLVNRTENPPEFTWLMEPLPPHQERSGPLTTRKSSLQRCPWGGFWEGSS